MLLLTVAVRDAGNGNCAKHKESSSQSEQLPVRCCLWAVATTHAAEDSPPRLAFQGILQCLPIFPSSTKKGRCIIAKQPCPRGHSLGYFSRVPGVGAGSLQSHSPFSAFLENVLGAGTVISRQPSVLMSYLLPHLKSGWAVDQSIVSEEKRVVVVRFGRDDDPVCMQMDDTLASIAEDIKNFAVIYLVDIKEVPDFNEMYELYDACTVMFFFRNKHIMVDMGTGNNNKVTWAITAKQEMIDIIETVYRGARKGRGLVISPKDYSTKYKY